MEAPRRCAPRCTRTAARASEELLAHRYKELTIPAGPGGKHRMEKNALHIWPRGEYMLIALPNIDGSFTVTLFLPKQGEESFAADEPEAVQGLFSRRFADAMPLIPASARTSSPTPPATGDGALRALVIRGSCARPGRCRARDRAFSRAGHECAFEDCGRSMNVDRYGSTVERVFARFERAAGPTPTRSRRWP